MIRSPIMTVESATGTTMEDSSGCGRGSRPAMANPIPTSTAPNSNSIGSRLTNLLEWLEREAPDIACLQELKAGDDAFPALALSGAGYGAIWHGQKAWNGVAILARGTTPVEAIDGMGGLILVIPFSRPRFFLF